MKCAYLKSSITKNVINKIITNTTNFKDIIIILCTENEIGYNALKVIDELSRSIFVTSKNNLVRKIESFL